ncbi:hypothetical protein QA600_12485 [Natronococcus sp. A-GB1]|uniref:phage NrS-1 polymerase family protein n=1 Tax=Natronococcus sp. A-GB1 TaxID=3037648 RepID=UPI00241E2CDF|nr:hypothetical protein [Natronococcus sp. A-GB1]MDG5760156.1 hypothetical protein [Natronococcus sp. A-GB1]
MDYYHHEEVDGLGYVFTADGPYAGVDIDDVRDPETELVEEWVLDVMLTLHSYTEYSPSGCGYHILVEGIVPPDGNRSGQLELYDHGRYFTVTGDRVPGSPETIQDRDHALTKVHTEYIAAETADTTPAPDPSTVTVPDDDLIEKAMNAANGDKFRALWIGDTSGYRSHSEADLALCNYLAFWTGGNPDRIEDLFNQSGLVRDKWRDREDYRDRTIQTAIQDCSSYYDA